MNILELSGTQINWPLDCSSSLATVVERLFLAGVLNFTMEEWQCIRKEDLRTRQKMLTLRV